MQQLHVLTTEIHRRDESAHSALFKTIGASVYNSLGQIEREFFLKILPQPIAWFANPELEACRTMLHEIQLPGADRMMDVCLDGGASKETHLDLNTLEELYFDLGVYHEFRV